MRAGACTQLGLVLSFQLVLSPVVTYALAPLAFDSGWMDTAALPILGFHTFARRGSLPLTKSLSLPNVLVPQNHLLLVMLLWLLPLTIRRLVVYRNHQVRSVSNFIIGFVLSIVSLLFGGIPCDVEVPPNRFGSRAIFQLCVSRVGETLSR